MIETAASPGWRATLDLHLQNLGGRTRIVHRRHAGPLLVQRAFYPEGAAAAGTGMGEPCHVYLIHPPGGLASGDALELNAAIGASAHALLTTPAAGKFYRRGAAGVARLAQNLRADGGMLEWLPQENIFYPHAAAELSTVVRLSGDARFVGWEMSCFGLPANDLTLASGSVRQAFELWVNGRPLLLERLHIGAISRMSRWGLAAHPVTGTWLGFPAAAADLETARAVLGSGCDGGCAGATIACTLVDEVLVCRALAPRADLLKRTFVALWRALRPAFTRREAVPPRVWAT